MDKLLSMQVFVAVVDSSGFTAAAERLPVSRAGVSKHIAELENSLGGRLLNRTTRRVSVTEVGRAYYEKCREILGAVEEAECIVSGLSHNPGGRLRLNAPMSLGHRHLGPVIAAFCERYPKISIDMILSDRIVDMVEEGFDVTLRVTRPPDSSLVAREIVRCGFSAVASPAYLQAHGMPDHPGQLRQHACLLYSYSPTPDRWSFNQGTDRQTVRVSGPLVSNNGDLLRAAAENHMGIALLPDFILTGTGESAKLLPVLQDYQVDDIGIYAVYASRRLQSEKIRRFVSFMVENFRI